MFPTVFSSHMLPRELAGRRSLSWLAASLLAVLLTACTEPQIAQWQVEESPPREGAIQTQSIDPARAVILAWYTQMEQDTLPAELAASMTAVDPSTTRFLGTHENRHFWLAFSHEGEVCAVKALPIQKEWLAVAGCAGPEHFARHGIFLNITGAVAEIERFSAAVVVPDGYVEDATRQLPTATVLPYIIVFDAPEAVEAAIETHGEMVSLQHGIFPAQSALELCLACLLP